MNTSPLSVTFDWLISAEPVASTSDTADTPWVAAPFTKEIGAGGFETNGSSTTFNSLSANGGYNGNDRRGGSGGGAAGGCTCQAGGRLAHSTGAPVRLVMA